MPDFNTLTHTDLTNFDEKYIVEFVGKCSYCSRTRYWHDAVVYPSVCLRLSVTLRCG